MTATEADWLLLVREGSFPLRRPTSAEMYDSINKVATYAIAYNTF
jgi:hypothetical protein